MTMTPWLRRGARAVLPESARLWMHRQRRRWRHWPPVGLVRFGTLGRREPISRKFGFDRGLSIDRHYIEQFLAAHDQDIQGRVLEVADNAYTVRFGGNRVSRSDILHVESGHQATIVADLEGEASLGVDTFDCIILTQTLQCVRDMRAALRTLRCGLKPGGVLLVSLTGIGQISRYDMDRWGDYWRFTAGSARLFFEDAFPPDHLTVKAYGNVLAAVAFLHGLATEDLQRADLEYRDDDYDLVVTVRAVKPLA